jgi:hypothetical protein
MENLQEQELPLQLCIIVVMQKEERPDSRNRQAAENDRPQNEDQIWQRYLRWCVDARIAASLGVVGWGPGSRRLGLGRKLRWQPGGVRLGALSEARPGAPMAGGLRGSALAFFNVFAANGSLSRPLGMGSAPADGR